MNILEARRRTLGGHILKKTAQGNPAIATDSLARMYPGIEMQGWTEQAKTTGAQILNESEIEQGFLNGNTGEESNSTNMCRSGFISIKPSTQYYFSGEYRNWVFFYNSDKTFISSQGTSNIISPDNAAYMRLRWYNETGDLSPQDVIAGKPMLNEGTTALPYEPYTGGQPSPSPEYPQEIVSSGSWDETAQKWEYELEMAGAQLLDETIIEQGMLSYGTNGNGEEITSQTMCRSDFIPIKPNEQYYFSGEYANYIGFYTADKEYINSTDLMSFQTPENALYVRLCWYSNGENLTPDQVKKGKPMLNAGSTALPYEPYKPPQTVTLTADRPLTKWDRLEKRNGQWGWAYKSNEKTYDGSADENWLSYANSTYRGFQIDCPDSEEGSRIEGFCDKFPVETSISGTDSSIWIIDKTLYFKNVSPKYASSVEEWKTWLQSNNIKVLYQTADETFVPLTTTEQEAMEALHTYRPTTVLSNQQDCDMTLTYKTRKGMS